ncbi:MAG: adenylate/guanylate cyclase domain-containing protein [Nitrospirae bacterium]|nr:MAG: adenylate/guanylate cyclase domain-containing protein [Nitrospirota bacterium]
MGSFEDVMAIRAKTQTTIPEAITQIAYPAYMVNRQWDIEWINPQAEELIFGQSVRTLRNIEERHFFSLAFTSKTRDLVTDFDGFIKSHLPLVQGDIPPPSRNPLLVPLGIDTVSWLGRIWPDEVEALPQINYREERFRFKSSRCEGYHRVAAMFREGILIIWIPTVVNLAPVLDLLTGRRNIINDLLINKLPAMRAMAVLVADLQNSVKISADLPPEEYFDLITAMWARLEKPFRDYGCYSGKHVGDGVVQFFLAKPGDAFGHSVNALLCANAIQCSMADINREWKRKKQWLNELVLNIGLHEGREWIGYIPSASTPEFTALGDTVNVTARVSGIGRNGCLWVSKHMLSALPSQILDHVEYGIRRPMEGRDLFIPKTYSRVVDLPNLERIPKSTDIANLSVTEVIRVDQPAIQAVLRSMVAEEPQA